MTAICVLAGTYQPLQAQLFCMSCPYGLFSSTSGQGSTSPADCRCNDQVSYSGSDGICIPCAACPAGTYMANTSCSSTGNPKCNRCGICQPMQFVQPDNLCDGTKGMDTQILQCQSCSTCISSTDSLAMVNPCYSGSGSVDTTVCVEGYDSVFAKACPDNSYLGINPTKYATTLPASHGILPNADGRVFAQMSPFAGVDIFPARSLDDAIMTDSQLPIMSYTPVPTGYRQIASMVWSLDGTTLFIVRMDAVIVRMRVFPENLRSMDTRWSAPDQYNSPEKPYSAQQLSPSIPVCVTLPQRPDNGRMTLPRQASFLPRIALL